MPKTTWQVMLGSQIRDARKQQKKTQRSLAEHLGLKRETVRLYERGKVAPSLETMRSIVEFLGAEFNVDGIRIGPRDLPPPTSPPATQQLPLAFDHRFNYRQAALSVRATERGLILEAVAS